MEKILVIEDDPSILDGLVHNLGYEGYEVLAAGDGTTGLDLALAHRPDLVLLDIMLPGLDGFALLKALERQEVSIPVIVITAKDQQADKVRGLDLGADDYLTKPFSLRELFARINAVLRRKRRYELAGECVAFGDIEIDFEGRAVRRAGEDQALSDREFRLLALLVRNKGRALSRTKILDEVWGDDYDGPARPIDTFTPRLRQKLERDPNDPRMIHTVRGVGYKFEPKDGPSE